MHRRAIGRGQDARPVQGVDNLLKRCYNTAVLYRTQAGSTNSITAQNRDSRYLEMHMASRPTFHNVRSCRKALGMEEVQE